MSDINCHYCKHEIRDHHRNLGCFGDDEECPCGLDEATVAKVALDAANAKLDAVRKVRDDCMVEADLCASDWRQAKAARDSEGMAVARSGKEGALRIGRQLTDALGED